MVVFLTLVFLPFWAHGMRMQECAIDYFKRYYIQTEYEAYLALKDNPLTQDVTYVAVPWTALKKKNKLDLVKNIRVARGCTVCSDIYYETFFPLFKQIGIDTLFTPHAQIAKTCDGITIVPFPHFALHVPTDTIQKDLLYSFVGINTKESVRGKITQLEQKPDTVITLRPKNFKLTNKEHQEYVDILARSRFSLCPRGTGPSTIRFWESLQAGAIPVVLADAMLLPDGFDWNSCVIRIPEKKLLEVDTIIRAISPDKEERMRALCLQAYKQYSGDNFVSVIRNYYATYTQP